MLALPNKLFDFKRSDILRVAGVAFLYALLVHFVFAFLTTPGNISIVWLPSGLGLAALLLGGRKYWIAIFIGVFGSYVATVERPVMLSAIVALMSNTLEPLIGVWLLANLKIGKYKFDNELQHPRDYFLLGIAAVLSAGVAALSGCTIFWMAGVFTGQTYLSSLMGWWMGNFIGMIILTPLLLVWRQVPQPRLNRERVTEAILCFGLAFLFGQIIFLAWPVGAHSILRGYWMFLFVTWGAVRFGRHGALLIICMTAVQGLLSAIRGVGFFASDLEQTGLYGYWFYVVILSAVGTLLALVINEREQIKRSLKESEAHFRFVSESAQAMIWMAGTDKLCTWFNKVWLEFTGRTIEQERGNGWAEGVHSDDLQRCLEIYVNKFDRREPFSMEYRLRRFDGEYRWILDNGTPRFSESGMFEGYIGSCFDFTDRKLIEEALKESEHFFKETQQKASIGSYKLDFVTGIWKSSDVLDQIFGIDRSYIRNVQGWLDLVHPDDKKMMDCYLRDEVISKRKPFNKDYRIIRKSNGEIRWVLGSGRVDFDLDHNAISMAGTIQDITDRKQVEIRLKLASNVYTHAREGILITDATGSIVDVNDTFSRITGYSREEAIEKNPRILKSGLQLPEFYKKMWQELKDNGYWVGEIWNRRKDGEVYAEMLSISAVHDDAGITQNYVGLISDITHMKLYEQQLEHIAHYDVLTNLPNRLLLDDRLQQAIAQSHRRSNSLAVVFLDLDGFKAVNDNHGHELGDEFLIVVSQRMKEALRDGDTLSRIGGDEFIAVLIDLEDQNDCEPVLDRLLQAASAPIRIGDFIVQVSASIGVALYPQNVSDANQLIRYADQAMYQAKQNGKNRYHLFKQP